MLHDSKSWLIRLVLMFLVAGGIEFVFRLPLAAAIAVSVLCISLFLGGKGHHTPPGFDPKRRVSLNLDDPL